MLYKNRPKRRKSTVYATPVFAISNPYCANIVFLKPLKAPQESHWLFGVLRIYTKGTMIWDELIKINKQNQECVKPGDIVFNEKLGL